MSREDRSLRGAAAIVGVADDVSPTGELDRTGRELEVAMVLDALEDAGLTLADVDGVCHPESAVAFAEYLGLHPTFVESTMTGGSSYEVHVEHAAAAIAAGVCDVVVSVYASTPRSDRTRRRPRTGRGMAGPNPVAEWELPFGIRLPMGPYALAAARHMHEFGTTSEQLASIAVQTAGVGRTEPARPLPRPADDRRRARLAAAGESPAPPRLLPGDRRRRRVRHDQRGSGPGRCASPRSTSSARRPAPTTWGSPRCRISPPRRARSRAPAPSPWPACGPADVDVLMGYDSFTITALLHLEDLGFCAKGEGGPFAAAGGLGPGGALPMNTNGGGLSFTHPGMYGMFLLTEAVRQLRGEGEARQVEGAEVAVAHGSGMFLSVMSTAVLGTEATL